jgi:hypothetical protein
MQRGTALAMFLLNISKCPVSGRKAPVSTALVPVGPIVPRNAAEAVVPRADAGFVAHLIAIRTLAPQTRTRRRAEPGEAVAAYAARNDAPVLSGIAVSRSL